jgi:hypothetical protein
VCTVVLALHPSLLMYERSVMLEIPSLAMVVAASFFWVQYLKQGHQRHLWCSLMLASLAVLTKYQAIYLGVFYVLSILGERKWRRLRGRTVILAIGVSLLLLVPFAFLALRFHGSVLTQLAFARTHALHPASTAFQGLNAYAYYWLKLPRQLGWPLLALSIAGLLTASLWSKRSAVTMLAWIVACYLTMSVVTSKEVRYTIYWLPPFVYFALAPLTSKAVRWKMYPLRTGIVLALLLGFSVQAWRYQRPYVSGYEAAARCVIQRNGPPLVLFDGDLPGNFIFFMRSLDPSRRFFILRKSLFVDGAGGKPAVQLIESRVALEDFIEDYGVKSVIISEHNRLEFPVQRYLHQLLRTPEFRLIKQFPVETNDAALQCHHLMLYERARASSLSARTLTLKMPTLGRDITVSLDQPFGR